MSEETDVNENSLSDTGQVSNAIIEYAENAVQDEDLVEEDPLEEEEAAEEEEEYQPKKRAAARRTQQTAKTKSKVNSTPKENGTPTDVRPKGRGRGRPRGNGRPGGTAGASQTKVIMHTGRGFQRGKRKKTLSDEAVVFSLDDDDDEEHVPVVRKKLKRTTKKAKRSNYVEHPGSDTDEDYDYEICEYNGHVMAIKPQVFHDEVLEAMTKWEAEWTAKEADDIAAKPCEKEGCNAKVPDRDLDVHNQCHKFDNSGFVCPHRSCDYERQDWHDVRTHISKTHRSLLEIWKCDQPDCGKQFTRWIALRRHIMYKHIYERTSEMLSLQHPLTEEAQDGSKKIKRIKRDGQDVAKTQTKKPRRKPVFGYSKNKKPKKVIKKETVIPKNRPLKCDKCFATYKGESALQEHMERHSQVIYTKCAECEEYFTEDSILQKHVKENHGQLLHMHRCSLCSYTSSYVSDLKIHQYTHQDTKFDCDGCGQVCANPKTLRSHRMRKHPDLYENKSLVCSFCGETCPNEVLLQDHARDKHHLRLNGSKRINTKEELRFPCNLCGYVGRKAKSLEYHMRLHQEERPFKCTHCTYASKTQNNLKLHMRTHKDLAPLKCPQCDFRGATNKVINQHVMSKHTKEKPYQCSVCSWSTCYSGNLWTHMQIHRKKDGIDIPQRPKIRKKPAKQVAVAEKTISVIDAAVALASSTGTALTQADLAAMTTTGLPQSVFTSAGFTSLTTSSVLTSATPLPVPTPIPIALAAQPISSTGSTISVAGTSILNIDQLPVIQMAQPLLQQQAQQVVAQQQHEQQQTLQAHAEALHRYQPQFATHIIPPVTTEGFQIGNPETHTQMVDIQIHDASRRSVVGTIPRQETDDMETVQQLVNLSNMLPTATSVLHNMQPAYARY